MSANYRRQPYTFDRVVRLLITALTLAAMLAVTAYLSEVLIPFVIAFLCAYLLNPIVNWVQRRIVKYRFPAIILTLLMVVVVGIAGMLLLIPAIAAQGQHLGQLLHNIFQDKNLTADLRSFLPDDWWRASADFLKRFEAAGDLGNAAAGAAESADALKAGIPENTPEAEDWWQALTGFFSQPEISGYFLSEKFIGYVRATLSKVLPFTATVFAKLFSGMVSIILSVTGALMIILYLVFILRDYERVSGGWQQLIPAEHREFVVGFVRDFDLYMNRYFRAQAVIAAFSALIMAVGFQIMGLPMGILLGIFCGALSMVPYLQVIGFIPAAILALIYSLDTGMSFWWICGEIALVFIVAQIIYDVILVPKIMGDVTGLSPAIILLSLSVWWKFLGVLGFLIALPMTCLILAYYQRLLARSEPPPPAAEIS